MEKFYPLMFAVLAVSCIGCMALQQSFLSRLRERHPEVWEDLGRPGLFFNSSVANGMALIKYMWRRGYESLNDNKTIAMGRILRRCLMIYLVLFATIMITFVATVKPHK